MLAFWAFGRVAITTVAATTTCRGMLLITEVLIQFGIERGFNGELYELLGTGSEVFLGLDVFGQFCGQGFKFFLVHLCTDDGVLLKRLLSRGQLHYLAYRLRQTGAPLSQSEWFESI